MLAILLTCLGLAAGDDGGKPSPGELPDAAAYRAAAEKAGHDARAHVRLALWCEAHGMNAERLKHLGLAVAYDPANTLARGLMGMVAYKGTWGRPEEIGKKIESDPAQRAVIEEYLARRAKTPMKADEQSKLAAWCEDKGLREQAIAHYSEVVRLAPGREAAWRHLGFKKVGGRWVKPDELAAERLEAERQKHADRQWKPKLERIRDGLDSKDPARCARTQEAITAVNDPRGTDDLGCFAPGPRAGADGGPPDARPDRRPGGVECAGRACDLQPVARGPRPGDRDPLAPRPKGRDRPADRDDPQAVQVRGAEG